MEIINQDGIRILVASEGKVLQSVTDGLVLGKKIILGKKDSEIHYHEIPIPVQNKEDSLE